MTKYNKVYAITFSFFIITALFLTIVENRVSNTSFYGEQYSKLDLGSHTGLSKEDYISGVDALILYVNSERISIQTDVTIFGVETKLYNQREIDHMIDVKELYINAMTLRNFSFIGSIISLLLFVVTVKKSKTSLYLPFLSVSKIIGVIVVCLGIVAFLDFNLFWNTFHEIFFTNDLWLLNPRTDWMIRMFPLELFYALVSQIIIIGLFAYGILFIVLRTLMKRGNNHG